MSWYAFDNEKSIGQRGSESGTIIRDEEHGDGARITLEGDGQTAPFWATTIISFRKILIVASHLLPLPVASMAGWFTPDSLARSPKLRASSRA